MESLNQNEIPENATATEGAVRSALAGRQAMMGLLVASLAAAGCAKPAEAMKRAPIDEFIAAYRSNPSIRVLDVRTPQEYEMDGHVPNAFLLPLQEIQSNPADATSKIPFSKDEEIYVICRSGNRSARAIESLHSVGFKYVINVEGGTSAWIMMGNSVEH